ncbi:MAG: GNAT family N-acetyltransferase [Bacteroidetes bacterium]|nr:GNAT family N-acetyltransferase [Bacteroidota bacterium]
MIIIPATPIDIAIIQDLARQSWQHAYKDILSLEQMEYMLSNFYSREVLENQMEEMPNYQYFLLKKDQEFLGFIGVEFHYEENTTKLHRLYLLPQTHGFGYGQLALDFLKNKSLAHGNRRIILNVNKYNSAIKFYEKQGFTIYDEGVFDIGNGFVMDDFLMEWWEK